VLEQLPLAQMSNNSETDIRALLGCCAACKSLPPFRDNLSVPSSRGKKSSFTHADGTDRLSRNGGNNLPLHAAQHLRRARISSVS